MLIFFNKVFKLFIFNNLGEQGKFLILLGQI